MSARTQTPEQRFALDRLRELCPPGTTVQCVLEHVSKSGMMRSIKLYVIEPDGHMAWLNGLMETAGLEKCWRKDGRRMDGTKVGGCGMDMGFHLVYNLASALYRDGFTCTGERCPSNEHSNGDRDRTPHHHESGGYALRSNWL